MSPEKIIRIRNFYLNEKHELTLGETSGGGNLPKYGHIDWAVKSRKIDRSLSRTRDKIISSSDPLRESRYFLLALPDKGLTKISERKGKSTEKKYLVNYAEDNSRVFDKLGLDLLRVNDDGTAIVHSKPEQFNRLLATAKSLEKVGVREQSRWAPLGEFDIIPPALRVDDNWLTKLSREMPTDAVVELQPLLTRSEIDRVLSSISEILRGNLGERLNRAGTDFS